MDNLIRMIRSDDGATAAEYALILAFVGSAIALAGMNLGAAITAGIGTASTNVQTCGGQC